MYVSHPTRWVGHCFAQKGQLVADSQTSRLLISQLTLVQKSQTWSVTRCLALLMSIFICLYHCTDFNHRRKPQAQRETIKEAGSWQPTAAYTRGGVERGT
jgi:hypothetical protein